MPQRGSLTGDHVAAATAVYQEMAAARPIALAAVSGSLAFGLGNAASDVDLHLVTDMGWGGRVVRRRGWSVQINVSSRTVFDDAVSWASTDPRDAAVLPALSEEGRSLAVRLTRAHVIAAEEWSRAELARIDEAIIRRRLIGRFAALVNSSLQDVRGALADGDLDTAYYAARIAVEVALEAAVAACGDLYLGRKFLPHRLERNMALQPVRQDIRHAIDLPTAGVGVGGRCPPDLVTGVLDNARLAGHVIGCAVLNGWTGIMEQMPAPVRPTTCLLRNAFHSLVRIRDDLALCGPDRTIRMDEKTARLWMSLDYACRNENHEGILRRLFECGAVDVVSL